MSSGALNNLNSFSRAAFISRQNALLKYIEQGSADNLSPAFQQEMEHYCAARQPLAQALTEPCFAHLRADLSKLLKQIDKAFIFADESLGTLTSLLNDTKRLLHGEIALEVYQENASHLSGSHAMKYLSMLIIAISFLSIAKGIYTATDLYSTGLFALYFSVLGCVSLGGGVYAYTESSETSALGDALIDFGDAFDAHQNALTEVPVRSLSSPPARFSINL